MSSCLLASVGRSRPSTRSRLRIRVIDSGRMVAEVYRELGIHESLLGTWVKDERRRIAAAEVHGEKPLDAAERAELLRLRRQVSELEKDNAFLVKASAYFAAMQKNRPGSI
ncbi:transposase [Nocardia elegans]|nr:transposase [Nocardia elegans]